LPASGLYDLLSFFPFSFKNNLPKCHGEKRKTKYLFTKNKFIMLFTGRLTADAEVKELKNDKKVTNFVVALNTKFKTKVGDKKEKTAFVDCSYWVNPGLAIYLTKGAVVEVNGWVKAEAYLSNKDQTAKSRLVCSVDKIKLFSTVATATQTVEQTEEQSQAGLNITQVLPMYNAEDALGTTGMNGDYDDDDLAF